MMVDGEPLILVLYVDDLFLKISLGLIEDCKRNLAKKIYIKDLGLMHYFLGLEVWKRDGDIFLGQGRYTTDILKRLMMHNCRSMSILMITNRRKIDALEDEDIDSTLYRHLTSSLVYLVNSRLNIYFAVNTFSYFMVGHKRVHWIEVRHKIMYLHEIIKYRMRYIQGDGLILCDFADEDFRQAVQWIRRAHQGVASTLSQGLYFGATGSRNLWH